MPWAIAAYAASAFAGAAVTGFASALAISAATAVVYVGVGLAVTAAIAYGASQVMKPKGSFNSAAFQDQSRSVMVRDPVSPRRKIYGQILTSGMMMAVGVAGTKNEDFHFAVIYASHQVEEIGSLYFGTELVPQSGSWDALGRFAGFAHAEPHDGAPGQAVDNTFSFWFPTQCTSSFRGDGIAYDAVRLKVSPDLWQGGLPNIRRLIKGAKVYDPRDVTQDSSDPTTWKYSNNAALCAADYIHDPIFGKGVPWARIDMTALIEAANICDENVVLTTVAAGAFEIGSTYTIVSVGSTNFTAIGASANTVGVTFTATGAGSGSGTAAIGTGSGEPRYTCNGVVLADQDTSAALRDLATAMAGTIIDSGGYWTIRAGAYRTPALTLGDGDLAGPLTVQPRMSRQDTYNGVKGVFVAPINDWQLGDFPGQTNSTYTTADGGIRLWKDVSLNFTTSSPTAQRLAKIDLERGRQQITFTALYKLSALNAIPSDIVYINRANLGWSNKTFEVTNWMLKTYEAGGGTCLGVELSFRETASGVWNWNNGEETVDDLSPNTTLPDASAVPTPSGLTLLTDSSTSITQQDGVFVPRLKVTWSSPNNIYVENGGWFRLEYKKHADSTWLVWEQNRGDILLDYITDVKVADTVDVRLQFINQLGVRGAYATVSNYFVAGDTAGPAAPTGLAAIAGTGKSVSLDWADNTEADFSEYGVWRNTVNTFGSATKIAEVRASRFVDVDVTIGTTYYYWITAFDRSENQSGASSGANATPGAVSGAVDTTAATDPAAPTFSSDGFYISGDGNVFSYIEINVPAMPVAGGGTVDAVVLNILYRKNGATGWTVADQRSAGGGQSRIDDLTPGVQYEIAAQAFSAYGYGSAIIAATGSPFTAPNKTGGPADPTGVGLTTDGVTPLYLPGTLVFRLGTRVFWDVPTDSDYAYTEAKVTLLNTDPDTTYTWSDAAGAAVARRVHDKTVCMYDTGAFFNGHVRVRHVNRSLVPSNWVYAGLANSSCTFGTGSLAAQNASDVAVSSVKMGSGASVRAILAEFHDNLVVTLAGGAASESFNVDITNRGFTTQPEEGDATCADPANDVVCTYAWSDGGNSSTNAVVTVSSKNGSNISAGARRFLCRFRQY